MTAEERTKLLEVTDIIEGMLKLKVLHINDKTPFQWTSGWLSPVYCDNRLILSDVALRTKVNKHMEAFIQKDFPDATLIAGVATAGIPCAAMLADSLGLPMIYVRSKAKEHGLGKQIEGTWQEGAKSCFDRGYYFNWRKCKKSS